MIDVGSTLERVMRQAGPRLAAYGFVLTGTQHDSEELVQEAIVKTFTRKPKLTDVAAAESYIRRAMYTLVIDKSRKEQRFRAHAAKERLEEVQPDVVFAITDRVAVSHALTQLTAQQRIAVALRYWDDLTVDQVAHAMKLRPGTVKRYLHDAVGALRPLLGEHVETEEDSIDIVDVRRKGGQR